MSRPGIDHETYYRDVIAPYKGELELWYLRHQGLRVYLMLIVLTSMVVLASESFVYKRWLQDLPPPPEGLPV